LRLQNARFTVTLKLETSSSTWRAMQNLVSSPQHTLPLSVSLLLSLLSNFFVADFGVAGQLTVSGSGYIGGKDISTGVGGFVLGLLDHFQQIRRSCMYPGRRRRVLGIIFSLQGESWFYHTC